MKETIVSAGTTRYPEETVKEEQKLEVIVVAVAGKLRSPPETAGTPSVATGKLPRLEVLLKNF